MKDDKGSLEWEVQRQEHLERIYRSYRDEPLEGAGAVVWALFCALCLVGWIVYQLVDRWVRW